MIRCECPREIAIRRIEQRRRTNESTSEAHRDLYDQQAAAWEQAVPPEEAVVIVDSRQTLQEQIQETLAQIAQLPQALILDGATRSDRPLWSHVCLTGTVPLCDRAQRAIRYIGAR